MVNRMTLVRLWKGDIDGSLEYMVVAATPPTRPLPALLLCIAAASQGWIRIFRRWRRKSTDWRQPTTQSKLISKYGLVCINSVVDRFVLPPANSDTQLKRSWGLLFHNRI